MTIISIVILILKGKVIKVHKLYRQPHPSHKAPAYFHRPDREVAYIFRLCLWLQTVHSSSTLKIQYTKENIRIPMCPQLICKKQMMPKSHNIVTTVHLNSSPPLWVFPSLKQKASWSQSPTTNISFLDALDNLNAEFIQPPTQHWCTFNSH